jgi:hypothetical protein
MGKKELKEYSAKPMDQRIPVFVTRLLREGRKPKMNPVRKRQRQVGKMMRRWVMRGMGAKFERETVITFNETESSASVWTASETVYRRLKNLGYVPMQDNERSAVFEVPRGLVKILRERPKRKLTEMQTGTKPHNASRLIWQSRNKNQRLLLL